MYVKWCRHPDGPVVLDGGVSKLTHFLIIDIPNKLNEIRNTPVTRVDTMNPSYDYNAWRSFYSFLGVDVSCSTNTFKSRVAEFERVSGSEIDRAVDGDDEVDLISFGNLPGAPKELRNLAIQQEKGGLDEKISEWFDRLVFSGEEDDVKIADLADSDDGLDVLDILVGESACVED